MANRRDYYFRQLVTEAELDAGFTELERADRDLAIDLGLVGISYGLGVSQAASPNLTVQVAGPGAAYDQAGQRMYVSATQVVNVAVDESALSTAVVSPGNSRIVSLFLEFDRTLSDPRIDGLSMTVYHNRAEAYTINVAVGAEAVSPTAPALRTDQILLADITRTFGQTQILNSDISTTRRQWMFKTTSGTTVAVGTAEEAVQVLATAIAAQGAASGIANTPAGDIAATTVQAAINELDAEKVSTAGDTMTGNLAINGAIVDFSTTPSNRAVGVDPGRNKLEPKNLVKVWCSVLTDGLGGVVFTDGYGVASVAIVGTAIRVTFSQPFAAVGQMALFPFYPSSGDAQANCSAYTTTTADIQPRNLATSANIDAGGVALQAFLMVMGQQS